MQLLTFQRTILGPVHLLTKTDNWDYISLMSLVLTSGKFLEALGSEIGTS